MARNQEAARRGALTRDIDHKRGPDSDFARGVDRATLGAGGARPAVAMSPRAVALRLALSWRDWGIPLRRREASARGHDKDALYGQWNAHCTPVPTVERSFCSTRPGLIVETTRRWQHCRRVARFWYEHREVCTLSSVKAALVSPRPPATPAPPGRSTRCTFAPSARPSTAQSSSSAARAAVEQRAVSASRGWRAPRPAPIAQNAGRAAQSGSVKPSTAKSARSAMSKPEREARAPRAET